MTIENKLKNHILKEYRSIREFTLIADIPYATLSSILSRGIENSSVGNVIKICKTLGISADSLVEGEIVPVYKKSSDSVTEIRDIVNEAKSRLANTNQLTIDGNVVDIEYTEPIIDALDIGYEMVKRKSAKEKA